MAFNETGMISYGTGGSINPTTQRRSKLWHYITADAKATVEGAGYFNSYAEKLQIGDPILVTSGVTSSAAVIRQYVVSNIASGVVTVTKSEIA